MSKTVKRLLLLAAVAWGFGVGYKTGRGKTYDARYELFVARRSVALFHEALHQCEDSLYRGRP